MWVSWRKVRSKTLYLQSSIYNTPAPREREVLFVSLSVRVGPAGGGGWGGAELKS